MGLFDFSTDKIRIGFARLLGDRDNGHWSICARDVIETRRAYRDGTLILVTHLVTKMGAARMIDFASETPATRALYGLDDDATRSYGSKCLLARRLSEAGVRFVQVSMGGWDHHGKLRQGLPVRCKAIDKPVAALITDLKQRGLLEDTLILWSTEFGRMPTNQVGAEGRDHNPFGFTSWMAGAGVKGGTSYGATDEFGYKSVEKPSSIYDFHATALWLLGLNHKQLTYYHNGVRRRLTDVHGEVLTEILA